jgi:hypothetical protein
MFAPHYGKHTQLGQVWSSAQQIDNALELLQGQAVLERDLKGNFCFDWGSVRSVHGISARLNE